MKYQYTEYKEKTNLKIESLVEEVDNCYNERQYLMENYENG